MKYIVALIGLTLVPGAESHDCNSFFRSHLRGSHHVGHHFNSPHVSYFVGQGVRVEALVEQALRSNPDWQEFQQFKAFKAGQAQKAPLPPAEASSPFLKSNCGRCHSGPEPAAGLILDGSAPIACDKVTKILAWLGGIEKPAGETMPGIIGKVKDQDKPSLMAELLKVRQK